MSRKSERCLCGVIQGHALNFFFGTEENGHALMQFFGLDRKNAFVAVGGAAAGLFHQPGHGIGFVHQTKLAGFGGIAVVLGVHEDSAAAKDAVYFGNHSCHPAHVVVLASDAGFAGKKFFDVAVHGGFPMALVRAVNRKFLGLFGHLHVVVGEDVGVGAGIKRKHHHAAAESERHLRLRTVHDVAGGKLTVAGLQKVGILRSGSVFVRIGQDRKDRSDRDVDVDVA